MGHLVARKMLHLLAVALLLCSADMVQAAQRSVLLLRSTNLKPYRELAEGFKETCSCDVLEYSLDGRTDLDLSRDLSFSRREATVAIGLDAVRASSIVGQQPVIGILVPCGVAESTSMDGVATFDMLVSPEDQLRSIRLLFPGRKRVGIIFNPKNLESYVKKASAFAASSETELVTRVATSAEQFPALLDSMVAEIDAFWLLPDVTVVTRETLDYLFLASFRHSLPVFAFSPKYLALGAAAATDIDPRELGRQAGELFAQGSLRNPKGGEECRYAERWRLRVNDSVSSKMGIELDQRAIRGYEKSVR